MTQNQSSKEVKHERPALWVVTSEILFKLYTVGRNTYKFQMNNKCNTFFLFEHIILLLENCTGNKDTSFKSWIQPYEKHIDLIEMTIERMDPCSVQ